MSIEAGAKAEAGPKAEASSDVVPAEEKKRLDEDIAMPVEVISFAQHASKEIPPAFGKPVKSETEEQSQERSAASPNPEIKDM